MFLDGFRRLDNLVVGESMAEGNGAGSARSRRRKLSWLRGTTLEALVHAAGTTP